LVIPGNGAGMEAKQLNFLLTYWRLVLRTPPTNIGNFTLSAQKRGTATLAEHSAVVVECRAELQTKIQYRWTIIWWAEKGGEICSLIAIID
jgi:hypothetical protein